MPRRARAEAGPKAKAQTGRLRAALPLGRSVFFGLIRLVNLAARPFADRIGRPFRLTLPEWRVMVLLEAHPGLTGAEIAFESGLDKMAVSRAIAQLERLGRVNRIKDPGDRRMERISLSAKGLDVFRRIEVSARFRESTMLSGLSAAERAALAEAVEHMTHAILAADFAPSDGSRG